MLDDWLQLHLFVEINFLLKLIKNSSKNDLVKTSMLKCGSRDTLKINILHSIGV